MKQIDELTRDDADGGAFLAGEGEGGFLLSDATRIPGGKQSGGAYGLVMCSEYNQDVSHVAACDS